MGREVFTKRAVRNPKVKKIREVANWGRIFLAIIQIIAFGVIEFKL